MAGKQNEKLRETRRRFNEVVNYRASDGRTLAEAESKESLERWIRIGRVIYGADWNKGKVRFVFAEPGAKEADLNNYYSIEDYIEHHIALCPTEDGTGGKERFYGNFDDRYDKVEVNNEYRNTYYDWLFNDRPDEELEKEHEKFVQRLNLADDQTVILTHNSNRVIKDGYVRPGQEPNGYSTNRDVGAYFWASKEPGRDPSNGSRYAYYCYVDLRQVYDYNANLEHFNNRNEVFDAHEYVANYWNGSEAIACNTKCDTPIRYILDRSTGKRYDKDWNELS